VVYIYTHLVAVAEVVCDTMLSRGYNARDGIELYWDDRVFNRTVWNSENVPRKKREIGLSDRSI
jgi:hypothetical protein